MAGFARQQAGVKFRERAERHRRYRQMNREANASRIKPLPHVQLDKLDFRLGVGVGAKKERKRLISQIM